MDAIEYKFNQMFIVEFESPYNYYGQRGFVDLIVYRPNYQEIYMYEIKTEIDDIGETLRQINRALLYYVKARDDIKGIPLNVNKVMSYFVFLDTEENWKTFNQYYEYFLRYSNLHVQIATDKKYFPDGLWTKILSEYKQFFNPPYIVSPSYFKEGAKYYQEWIKYQESLN